MAFHQYEQIRPRGRNRGPRETNTAQEESQLAKEHAVHAEQSAATAGQPGNHALADVQASPTHVPGVPCVFGIPKVPMDGVQWRV